MTHGYYIATVYCAALLGFASKHNILIKAIQAMEDEEGNIKEEDINFKAKCHELPSMTAKRKKRILWLGYKIANYGHGLKYEKLFYAVRQHPKGLECWNSAKGRGSLKEGPGCRNLAVRRRWLLVNI
jgi:hypothetical protein